MANQTFTNLLINDEQFAALQLPPKAPSSHTVEPNNVSEGSEILFQASNVLKTHENPSLSFLGPDQQVSVPPNSPINEDLAGKADSMLEAKMKRMQANRMYAARYRLKKVARLQQLVRQSECLEEEVSMIRSQILYWESSHNKLVEENAQMRAHFEAAVRVKAEKEAENWTLMQEIESLKDNQFYY